jgi:N-carbamoylputrescine amidase
MPRVPLVSEKDRVVRVGLVQHSASEDRTETIERSAVGLRQAAALGAQVVCLQELFASPYFCQEEDPKHFERAESLDGPTIQAMKTLAQEHKVCVLAGIFERRAPGVYHNSLVVLGPSGDTLGVYRKMHIPDDPQFMEKYYFAPGDLGFVAVETPFAKLGTLICWDQWYPEAARLTAMQGAEILFYPTAIGWMAEEKAEHGAAQLDAWKTMQRAHAIANGVYTVAVNRVGVETSSGHALEFWGHSFVTAPSGQVIAEAGESDEVLVVECDLRKNEEHRQTWPFFRDRRIDAYQGLTKRWGNA